MPYPTIDYLIEILEEIKIIELMKQLNRVHRPNHFLIKHATIIHSEYLNQQEVKENMMQSHDQVIRVQNGIIREITPSETIHQILREHQIDRIMDASDMYAFPGLTDCHVHLDLSNSQHLLNIVNGITSVREMCGFPYVLKQRDLVSQHQLFAPTIYTAGTMLNEKKMGRWTEVINSKEEARAVVQKHKKMGYDYIKVWNQFNLEFLQAAAEEAEALGIPIIGHIPHNVSVKDAIAVGMKTLEHFKGYLNDYNLTESDEDYVSATPEDGVWNCPTFIIQKNQALLGDDAREFIASDEMKYISPYIKKRWLDSLQGQIEEIEERGINTNQIHYDVEVTIFKKLLTIDAKYLAGTDCGGGMKAVPGFVLHDELSELEKHGLSHNKILASATINAGKALFTNNKIGMVSVGSLANLVLLRSNPLNSLEALKDIEAVMVMGRYLDKETLKYIRKQIKGIYTDAGQVNEMDLFEKIETFLNDPINHAYIKPHFLNNMAEYCKKKGEEDKAIEYYQRILDKTGNIYDKEKLEEAEKTFRMNLNRNH